MPKELHPGVSVSDLRDSYSEITDGSNIATKLLVASGIAGLAVAGASAKIVNIFSDAVLTVRNQIR